MELTAEQKYLKALAEWLDIENIPKNRIQEASREYLDQFTDVGKKVELRKGTQVMAGGRRGTVSEKIANRKYKISFYGGWHGYYDIRELTIISDSEKIEPEWKPEVGKLYKRTLNGVVTEITKLKSDRVLHILQRFDYDPDIENGYHEDYIIDFIKEYEPIAELEGLKVGYKVYTYGNDGKVHSFFIEGKFPFDDFITIKSTQGGYRINITLGGYFPIISNKQLFWRTADRAERFGRGDA